MYCSVLISQARNSRQRKMKSISLSGPLRCQRGPAALVPSSRRRSFSFFLFSIFSLRRFLHFTFITWLRRHSLFSPFHYLPASAQFPSFALRFLSKFIFATLCERAAPMHTVSGAACLATKNDSDFVTNDGYPKIKHISFYARRVYGRRVNGRRVCAAPAAPGVVRACSMDSPREKIWR